MTDYCCFNDPGDHGEEGDEDSYVPAEYTIAEVNHEMGKEWGICLYHLQLLVESMEEDMVVRRLFAVEP